MKTIIALCGLIAAVVAFPGDTYDVRYDNFNAQEIADNVRLLKSYGKCFLDKGPCTTEGADFKKSIPEALRTTCAKCTPKQRELIRIVVRAFQTKLPDVWEELSKKEDPTGEFKDSFNAFVNGSD